MRSWSSALVVVFSACVRLSSAVDIPIAWDDYLGQASKSLMAGVGAGDVLKFTWTGNHNVFKMASKAAFDACDFTGATDLTVDKTAEYTLTGSDPTFFACKIGSHCTSVSSCLYALADRARAHGGVPLAQTPPPRCASEARPSAG